MHPSQPDLPPHVETEWLAALHDSGIDPVAALLYPLPGEKGAAGGAAHFFQRDRQLYEDSEAVELAPLLPYMNADDCIDAYRVALHVERPVEGIAALLRHELEHAMQYDADVGQRLHRLYVLAVEVICERVGGLPGGGFLYQLIPVELDANAAAATYVRGRFGEARISMLLAADHPDSAAFRSLVPPPARETLADRMLHFFATIPDLCELRADRERMSFAEILAREWPGADGVWRRFFGTGELSLAGDQ